MDWEKLKIFRYVAQEQSFTHAGVKLNLSQSAASRQIKKLEEEIGVMLFHETFDSCSGISTRLARRGLVVAGK